jgi:hypothetical protein
VYQPAFSLSLVSFWVEAEVVVVEVAAVTVSMPTLVSSLVDRPCHTFEQF